ncbi:MAG: phage terminase large subunit family protein, partial [Deltaproteobacteria bacterium]|nr:phage terminase large subunit family protein [Deltaproteobacteria bacterium]
MAAPLFHGRRDIQGMIQAQYEFQFTDAERRAFRMKEKISTSGWAEKYRYVTNGPRPGRWSNKVTPYCTLPMDMWDDPYVRRIILRWPPQSGKTQVAFNCLCKAIDTDPGPAMYVMPDEKVAKRISRRRIIPMFRETPKIAELLSPRPDDVS